jgi:hypothetical protein
VAEGAAKASPARHCAARSLEDGVESAEKIRSRGRDVADALTV